MMTACWLKNMSSKNHFYKYSLITISSILLGIWAVKDTIALRNILLGLGFILGLAYIHSAYRKQVFKGIQLKNWLPIILMSLMLLWVLMHYLFLSRFPEVQLQELKSTWLRTFLAMVVGVSAGLTLHKNVKLMNVLWLGIGLSFLYLFFQYVPRAYASKNIFAVDWYGGYYIYIGKINGVLMGTILFCGLGSTWIDHLRSKTFTMSLTNTVLPLLGMALTLYSYVFIFDTRNGLGISALMVLAWTAYAGVWFLSQGNLKKLLSKFKGILLLVVLTLGIFSWFAYQQTQHNSGWLTMIEDAKIATQLEKYPNWQNPAKYGYPITNTGREVAGNTYERVAWATAGVRLIPENILGVGVLAKPFTRLLQEKYPGATPPSTHSAWIEFTLAFGLPGFILIFGSLASILYLTIASPHLYLRVSVISIALTLMLLYTLGELSTQHGVEVLFYLMALLTGLRMPIGLNATSKNGLSEPVWQ